MARSWFRRDQPGLPANWTEILAARSAQWHRLDDTERALLGELTDHVVRTKRWEAARGLELTDEIRTLVAAHAALLLLGLDEASFDGVRTIVVRKGPLRKPPPTPGWGPVAGVVDGSTSILDGETHDHRGPLMINWAAFRREAANPRFGRDVVLHEFAHKIDMHDLSVDGTPMLPDLEFRRRWIDICTREFEAVRDGHDDERVLRDYAGTNPAEFFAVTTEVFFTRAALLEDRKPELYDVFRTFYGQHPAERERRTTTPGVRPQV